jgi:hypothetical protein
MASINTGGGGSVGGNADAGGDFVGRDQYNVYSDMSPDEKLTLLVARVIGDPWRGDVGLVSAISEINSRLQRLERSTEVQQERRNAEVQHYQEREREVDNRFNAVYFWISILGLAVGAELVIVVVVLLRTGG